MKTSDAQKRASAKWDSNNRQKKNYIVKKSTAKSFIKVAETEEELRELEDLIEERRKKLKKLYK
ncbi:MULTISPECIES: hypothetical protein [unclassified Gemella]|uniref:hypothetical protein n=1 Tax=unclassified Gemella TaxID=2624949 RepID=UPI0010742AD1|nr:MULTISPECIES: hypothetical protein [unclassified Gemella]MBF0709688.1 hypothetical protein [Gemella sp. GL1.1]MBF0746893.1 hypothetical protein [Gemella sp. 19428wG2_WT2a]NYS27032.1 hypothetical protein [Gemella sp. GL1]TFU59121.1 hypothetical protein E4T67_04425 [Gemella sp. WT2a]